MCKKHNLEQALRGLSLIINPLCNTVALQSMAPLLQWHWPSWLTQILCPWISVPPFIAVKWGLKSPGAKYRFLSKTSNSDILATEDDFFFFTIILGSQNNWWVTLYTEKGCGSIPVSTHAMRGEQKCSLLQTELKGLMDHTAYLIFWKEKKKSMWTPGGSVSYCSAFCRLFFLSLSLASTCRGETDKTGRRRAAAAASVGFTVATETVSSLLNTCFWWHHMAGLSTHNERFTSMPSLNPETGWEI